MLAKLYNVTSMIVLHVMPSSSKNKCNPDHIKYRLICNENKHGP